MKENARRGFRSLTNSPSLGSVSSQLYRSQTSPSLHLSLEGLSIDPPLPVADPGEQEANDSKRE